MKSDAVTPIQDNYPKLLKVIPLRNRTPPTFLKPTNLNMSTLEKRRNKVFSLYEQAQKDKQHHKQMQAIFILGEIAKRETSLNCNRITKLNQLR